MSPRRHVATCVLAAVALAVGSCASDSRDEADVALERTVREYFLGMAAERPDENRAAMARIVPTADDFAALLPASAESLWAVWGPEAARLVAEAPARAQEYREALPIVAVRTSDLRRDAPLVLARSLAFLPPELPVRGVVIELRKGERVASAFVPVRGRWIWIWDLERLGSIASAPR